MNTSEIQTYLRSINVTEFSQRHKLPLRTLSRIKATGTATRANAILISDAIKKDIRKEKKNEGNK